MTTGYWLFACVYSMAAGFGLGRAFQHWLTRDEACGGCYRMAASALESLAMEFERDIITGTMPEAMRAKANEYKSFKVVRKL